MKDKIAQIIKWIEAHPVIVSLVVETFKGGIEAF